MAEPLWTLAGFADAIGGRLAGQGNDVTGIAIDSRTLAAGDAFFAIQGDRFDGHDFVEGAIARGAAVAVVTQGRCKASGPLIEVPDDPLRALERLGVAARARSGARVVAVTGSVGKTGTKEALRLALGAQAETHASTASFNNHWGVPLSLARLPASAAYAVFEIGMNHAGEITPLTRMVRPHVAVVTTVEPVHLEFFPSVEAIADAKAEIFLGLEPGGTAIVNRDNPHFARLARAAKAAGALVVAFGELESADLRLSAFVPSAEGSRVRVSVGGRELDYGLGAPGRHVAMNSLAVLAAVQALGADLEVGAQALAALSPPKGRGVRHALRVRGASATLIDESYNANPASMRAAIGLLGEAQPEGGGRRIAVLGDMLELGTSGADLHCALAPAIEAAEVDRVFLSGPLMLALWEALPPPRRGLYATTSDGLAAALAEELGPGDVVMVKGSLGSKMGPLVDMFLTRFAPFEAQAAAAG